MLTEKKWKNMEESLQKLLVYEFLQSFTLGEREKMDFRMNLMVAEILNKTLQIHLGD